MTSFVKLHNGAGKKWELVLALLSTEICMLFRISEGCFLWVRSLFVSQQEAVKMEKKTKVTNEGTVIPNTTEELSYARPFLGLLGWGQFVEPSPQAELFSEELAIWLKNGFSADFRHSDGSQSRSEPQELSSSIGIISVECN